jgi:LPS export ABC transporter protein LptC
VIKRSTRRGIVLLALLAILTGILSREHDDERDDRYNRLDTRLNYALYDFEGRLLNERGAVHLEIRSPVLRNDARSGVGTIDKPSVRIQQEDEQWYISAETAIISADRERVDLRGGVDLKRVNEITGQELDISTMDVQLDVTPRTASTQAHVTIRQEGDRLDAMGMRLDMVSRSFELLEDVRAHYETP